jgi:tetratricopeptide (TPR) repeat protein
MKNMNFFLVTFAGIMLFLSGCGAAQPASGAEQDTAAQPPPNAMEYYNHYMGEAGMAQSEERNEDALENYLLAADALKDINKPCIKKADAHYEAAQLAYKLYKKEQAIEQYKLAADIYIRFKGNAMSKAAVVYTNMGVVWKEIHETAKARTCWQQALEIYKSMPESGQNAGNIEKINQNIRDLDEGF